MIHFLTTGVIGRQTFLVQSRLRAMAALTLRELLEQGYFTDAPVPSLLLLSPPFSREDLRANRLEHSPEYRLAALVLQERLQAAAQTPTPHYVLGYEYGLGFVPMIAVQREEINRMAALQAKVVAQASRYDIIVAGCASIPVFDRSHGALPCPSSLLVPEPASPLPT